MKTFDGYENSFWRCIHNVDSLLFQDYEFMKKLRDMLCEARQMLHPDVGKTWEEIAEEEIARDEVKAGSNGALGDIDAMRQQEFMKSLGF